VTKIGEDTSSNGLAPLGSETRDVPSLIALHQAMVWRYLRALGADVELADDLTQETFLEIIRRPLEQISDAATAGYLRRVAHNLLISRRRREGRVVITEHAEHMETAWTRWAGFDGGEKALEALAECFAMLTERAKLALQLRFIEDASRQAIADSLGVGEHGAKNLMQRAKGTLKECVEQKLAQLDTAK
jgi:RNA polymerase sigma-70 factor (ECF subfamily)